MFEPAGQFGDDQGRSGAPANTGSPADADIAGPADAPPYPHCSRCHTDLTHCFLSARFCPRCGAVLAALPDEPPGESLGEFPGETLPAVPVASARLPLPALSIEPSEGRGTHSLILGFANAMFRLGWRYENGDGTCRNIEEAVRCYFKAAKLGNASAQARLMPRRVPPLPYDGNARTAGEGGSCFPTST